jgi:hypothetical protein
MKIIKQKSLFFVLPFALLGFAVAQPTYQVLLATPQFLLSRQNTALDVFLLSIVLSVILPFLVWTVCRLLEKMSATLAAWFLFLVSMTLIALFVAQLIPDAWATNVQLFITIALISSFFITWVLLNTRWSELAWPLALISLLSPLWFLLISPVFEQLDEFAAAPTEGPTDKQALPDVIFVLFDELPLATLLDNNLDVDSNLFPGFARLQAMSDWYFNTTSVSDGTSDAVPAILTGKYPKGDQRELAIATHPVNLFTNLRQTYHLNVSESVTRFCPQSDCPRVGPAWYTRLENLLLDLSAIYLHRVSPLSWQVHLPDVTNNWSGFFAERQRFFPDGWLENAGEQTIIDRPAFFRRFIASIEKRDKPTLNFIHLLFPHGPTAYLPDGRNYGLHWMRGQQNDLWEASEWGIISAKQRHYLQTRLADHLIGELIDYLEQKDMLKSSALVVLSDHGIGFKMNERRRVLAEKNIAGLLRVPMFFKKADQLTGRRIEAPVMTIDLLPTLLASLGFDTSQIKMDGKNLGNEPLPLQRKRYAKSFTWDESQLMDEHTLGIEKLVAENRQQLKLDQPADAFWNIGPFDAYRGQPLSSLCNTIIRDNNVHVDGPTMLPRTLPEDSIRLFITGAFTGKVVGGSQQTFVITDQETIVASGESWTFNGTPMFFALVEPDMLKTGDWSPEAWFVDNSQCHGKK